MDLVKGQLTSSVVGKIGGLLGESESATSSAIGKVIPSILGGLMSKTGSSAGASQIFDLLSKGGHDGSIFNDLGGLLAGGDKTNGLMDSGSNLANAIFGNKTNSMMDMVGKAIGFGNRSSSSLVSLLLPMVMGMIGKVGKEKNLDAGGIASLLSSQKDHIVGHAPAGLFESLGLGGLVGGAIGGVKNIAGGVTDAGSKVVGGTMDAGKKVVGGTMDAGKKVVGGVTDAGSKVVGGTMDAGKKVVGGVADAG